MRASLKVLVCLNKSENADFIYKKIYSLLSNMKIKCELSYSTNAKSIISKILEQGAKYDIYLLDCCDQACVELANVIRKTNLLPSIIFLNEPTRPLKDLIKLRPSFIVETVEDDKTVKEALKWCFNEQISSRTYFNVKNKDLQMRVSYDNILFFESKQRIVTLYSGKQAIDFYAKLNDVQSKIPSDRFVRCHQSYIVNMSKISQLDKVNHKIIMQSGSVIDISKSQYKSVIDEYERFLSAQ